FAIHVKFNDLVKSKVGARSPCPYIRCLARNPGPSGTEECGVLKRYAAMTKDAAQSASGGQIDFLRSH
ncbi:MAG: hypothetical protein Q7W38_01135, partial [Deltaproteobacteria bacterium]|nr:hypothetical protein [Deltaproteobacteria bacterium]